MSPTCRALTTCLILLFAPPTTAADAPAKLTDDELIREYEAAGLALEGTIDAPTDDPISRAFFDGDAGDPRNARLAAARAEIARRGQAVVPALIAFLDREAPISRPRPKNGVTLSFTGDVLRFLKQAGDPRAAAAALRVLEGEGGGVNEYERRTALDALEELTMVCFHRVTPHHGNYADSLQHPNALPVGHFGNDWATPAKLYRAWLDADGKDPSKWLAIARARARELLKSADVDAAYCAATFVRPAVTQRDDDPAATIARIGEIVGKLKPSGERYFYTYEGKLPASPVANWTLLLCNYGPRARPYAAALIRIQRDHGDNNWSYYAQLRQVGGREIVAHLVTVLPKVSTEVAKLRADPATPKGFSGNDQRGWWFDAQREVRLGIDRWAGRTFGEDDTARTAWWAANKDKSPEECLAANLETLAKQADAGETWARWLAREVLPNLPAAADEAAAGSILRLRAGPLETSPSPAVAPINGPFRARWLAEHRAKLAYDGDTGTFRIKK